jgi:hypothetical protein
MDKTMISLLTGASALALVGGVESSAAASLDQANGLQPARSFAELLEPIPNAAEVLRAEHERDAAKAASQAPVELAQYYYNHHHYYHHHHHHHYWPWRRHYNYYHHHHHHHYWNNY